MAEIVNLRLARKAKLRGAKEAAAQEKRLLHGRTRAQRKQEAADKVRVETSLDQAKRER